MPKGRYIFLFYIICSLQAAHPSLHWLQNYHNPNDNFQSEAVVQLDHLARTKKINLVVSYFHTRFVTKWMETHCSYLLPFPLFFLCCQSVLVDCNVLLYIFGMNSVYSQCTFRPYLCLHFYFYFKGYRFAVDVCMFLFNFKKSIFLYVNTLILQLVIDTIDV